jgi:hypothetical protein
MGSKLYKGHEEEFAGSIRVCVLSDKQREVLASRRAHDSNPLTIPRLLFCIEWRARKDVVYLHGYRASLADLKVLMEETERDIRLDRMQILYMLLECCDGNLSTRAPANIHFAPSVGVASSAEDDLEVQMFVFHANPSEVVRRFRIMLAQVLDASNSAWVFESTDAVASSSKTVEESLVAKEE